MQVCARVEGFPNSAGQALIDGIVRYQHNKKFSFFRVANIRVKVQAQLCFESGFIELTGGNVSSSTLLRHDYIRKAQIMNHTLISLGDI